MNVWESDVKYHTAKPRRYTALVDETFSSGAALGSRAWERVQLMAVLLCGSGCPSLSRVLLFATPGLEPPGSSVHGVSQARGLAWVTMPSSRGPSQPRDRTQISHVVTWFFTVSATREPQEWVAYPFSRGSSQPRYWTRLSCIAADSTSWATREAHDSLEFSEFCFLLEPF